MGTSFFGGGAALIEPRAGPELVLAPRGSQFIPNAGGMGATVNIYFQGTGGPTTPAEAAEAADLLVNEFRVRGIPIG